MSIAWLRAVACPLLQPQADAGPPSLRLVQRLLELALARHGAEETAVALLEEIAAALQADSAGIWEMAPAWRSLWQHVKRGTRGNSEAVPKQLLGEVLDRE